MNTNNDDPDKPYLSSKISKIVSSLFCCFQMYYSLSNPAWAKKIQILINFEDFYYKESNMFGKYEAFLIKMIEKSHLFGFASFILLFQKLQIQKQELLFVFPSSNSHHSPLVRTHCSF